MKRNQLTKAMKEVIASMVLLLQDGKNDEEILTASKVDKIGDIECTDDLLLELLGFAKEDLAKQAKSEKQSDDDSGKMFGNKDDEKKYSFPVSWKDSIVVRESQHTKVGPKESDVVEIPSSVKIKPFDKSLFDLHVKQGMFDKKNVEIIHDPR